VDPGGGGAQLQLQAVLPLPRLQVALRALQPRPRGRAAPVLSRTGFLLAYMFKTACNNGVRLAGIPATRPRQPVRLLPIITMTVACHSRRGDPQSCAYTHPAVDILSGSREFRLTELQRVNCMHKIFFV
jgi:hypothetical protein